MAARTFTIDQIIAKAEKETDTENDTHLSSAEKFDMANTAIAETWDAIIDAGLGEKYVKSKSFPTVAGTLEYSLFSTASDGDFYRIHQLYVDEGSGMLRPLPALNPAEIQSFRPPQSAVTMKLYYIPYSPILTTGQTFDGINGWEDHAVLTMAMMIKRKKEDSVQQYRMRKAELEARMRKMGQVDFAEPRRVVRKRRSRVGAFDYIPYNSNVNAYLVRGDKLEIFYNYGGYLL